MHIYNSDAEARTHTLGMEKVAQQQQPWQTLKNIKLTVTFLFRTWAPSNRVSASEWRTARKSEQKTTKPNVATSSFRFWCNILRGFDRLCETFKDIRVNATYMIWLTEEYTVHERPLLLESDSKKNEIVVVDCLMSRVSTQLVPCSSTSFADK